MAEPPDTAFPHFTMETVENPAKSREAGHAIFDDVEMVEIILPGSPKSTWSGLVAQKHKERWPTQYAAWKAGMVPAHDGTPLEQWAPLSRGQALSLKSLEIHTVEQLAGCLGNEMILQRIGMGARALCESAKAWLEQRAGGDALLASMAREEALKAQLTALETNYADLAGKLRHLTEAQAERTPVAADQQ